MRRAPSVVHNMRVALMALALVFAVALLACSQQAQGSSAAVAVKGSASEYSWSELSAISAEIASAGDAGALDVARKYHLTADDGTLDGTQAKEVELADGTKTVAVIAGFNHDAKPGGDKAGITFIFVDAVAMRGMNNDAGLGRFTSQDDTDALGGWAGSDARRWLNDEFAYQLPADLRDAIVPVEKTSCMVPEFELGGIDDQGAASFSKESLLGTSVDALWLPAAVELAGSASLSSDERPEWNEVLQGEGSQYQMFSDSGVSANDGNDVLKRALPAQASARWWLRSLQDATFADVRENGSLDCEEEVSAGTPQGIVPCFAI